jgi:hypothetical protein
MNDTANPEIQAAVSYEKQQAEAQYKSIVSMVEALEVDYDRLDELQQQRDDWIEENSVAEPDELKDANRWAEAFPAEAQELLTSAQAADGSTDKDDAEDRIREDPLECQVRSGWVSPGEDLVAEDFLILLCTGGPAVRIRGEFNKYGEPSRAWLEHQDWGTPWTQYFGAESSVLCKYASYFFSG